MEPIIEVKGLTKTYGRPGSPSCVHAVKGIDFTVETGSLFAFLGVNGAGKSTTIDMISTLLQPDGGSANIGGHTLGRDDGKIRSIIGIVFQDSLLDPLLTVRENMLLRGSFYGMAHSALKEAVERAAKTADVLEFIDRRYGKLSGGQRRRADIARALVNTPKILFLDEPTTGLDPQTRRGVWATIRELQRNSGMTVFLTTHYMEEAAQADDVTVMGGGEILAQGTPTALKERYSTDVLKFRAADDAAVRTLLEARGIAYTHPRERFHIRLKETVEALPILDLIRDNIRAFEVVSGTMDDVFLNITGAKEED